MSFNRELKAGGGAGAGGACRQRPSHPLAPLPSQLLASSSACTCPVLYTMSRHRNIQRTKDIFLLYFLSGVRRRSQECSLLPHTPPEVPFHFTGQNQFTGPSLSQSPARGAASLALPVAPSLTPDMASASPEAQDCVEGTADSYQNPDSAGKERGSSRQPVLSPSHSVPWCLKAVLVCWGCSSRTPETGWLINNR